MLRIGVLLNFCFLLLFSHSLWGQGVRGELVEEGTGIPIHGALVVLLDESGQQRGAALTDPRGSFVIHAPGPGPYRLRAERIGYASITSPLLQLTPGETLSHRMVASVQATELPGITATGERRCVRRPQEGRATHRLWEEARKALNATAWTEEQRLFRYTAVEYERELELGTLQVEAEQSRVRSRQGGKPFVSRPASELAREGYVRSVADTIVYYAPDAEALLSDAFLDTHCFRVQRGGADEGLLGLSFEPVRGRQLRDIEGVLWLDEKTAELRYMEYGYTWLPLAAPTDVFGGRVEFERLPTGAWIIRRWRIRMPIAGIQVNWSRGGEQQEIVAAIKERGGEVTQIFRVDGVLLAQSDRAALEGLVFDSTRAAPLPGARVYVSATRHSATTDKDGRFRMEGLPEGQYAVGFDHPRLDSLGIIPALRHVSLQLGQVAAIELAVPSLARILAAGCPESERGSGPGILVGLVRDSLTRVPLSGIEVTLSWHQDGIGQEDRLATRTDQEGAFRFCAAPTGVPVRVTAHVLGRSSAPLRVRLAGKPVQRDLTMQLTRPARVLGRVLDRETSQPILGATVELAGTGSRTTDEEGRFAFSDIPPGSYALTLRHIAYGTHSDSLFVRGEGTFDVEVRLAETPIALDPITVTVSARSSSPLLSGFYERKERGLGHFLVRDDLERLSATRLTDVLRRVPGVRVVPAGPGRYTVRMVRQPVRLGSGATGPEGCPPTVYIDGMPWRGPVDELTVADLHGVEVYRGASELPAEFGGSDARCGAIVLWSRRGG